MKRRGETVPWPLINIFLIPLQKIGKLLHFSRERYYNLSDYPPFALHVRDLFYLLRQTWSLLHLLLLLPLVVRPRLNKRRSSSVSQFQYPYAVRMPMWISTRQTGRKKEARFVNVNYPALLLCRTRGPSIFHLTIVFCLLRCVCCSLAIVEWKNCLREPRSMSLAC